jgi:nucleoid DNA-binding protein
MNKSELINAIADKADLSKTQAEAALNALTGTITTQLQKNDTVTLVGFGSFSVKTREARTGRNPQTGEPILIAASRNAAFKAGANLKNAVN